MKIPALGNLDNILYFLEVTLGSFFPVRTMWKVIHLALNCCCTHTPEHNPPLPLSPKYLSPCLSLATILWIFALARAVSLIISPWIRHYWAMSTQETAGNSQLASLSIIEQSCSYRLGKLNHLKHEALGGRIITFLLLLSLSPDLWQPSLSFQLQI